jgi:ABC-type uncharacterized transport system substrate-binding protein
MRIAEAHPGQDSGDRDITGRAFAGISVYTPAPCLSHSQGPTDLVVAMGQRHPYGILDFAPMIDRFVKYLHITLAGLLSATWLGPAPACAHPHVWVTAKSEVVYAADGSVTGVRHAWTFDDMFSAFAVQGLEPRQKGVFSREDLAPLAQVNITSLKEFDYFTHAKADGKKLIFTDPTDYWLDYHDNVLTLHFTLPLKAPLKAKTLALEIYDPTFFVDFSFADREPVSLAGAPADCKLNVQRPAQATSAPPQQLGESFFNALTSSSTFGARFANGAMVMCP